MKPYYDEDGITLYHADARELLPSLEMAPQLVGSVIVTDPPYGVGKDYGDGLVDDVQCFVDSVNLVASRGIPSAVFLPASRLYDLPVRPQWTGVWSKLYGASGLIAYPIYPHWDAIAFYHIKGDYSGNRGHRSDVFEFSPVRGIEGGHPTPKPLDLMCELVRFMAGGTVVDPFMGSGTTLYAAKLNGRNAIGIERNESYCEIAANRLRQGVLNFSGAA